MSDKYDELFNLAKRMAEALRDIGRTGYDLVDTLDLCCEFDAIDSVHDKAEWARVHAPIDPTKDHLPEAGNMVAKDALTHARESRICKDASRQSASEPSDEKPVGCTCGYSPRESDRCKAHDAPTDEKALRELLRRALADLDKNDWGVELPSDSEAWVYEARTILSHESPKEQA